MNTRVFSDEPAEPPEDSATARIHPGVSSPRGRGGRPTKSLRATDSSRARACRQSSHAPRPGTSVGQPRPPLREGFTRSWQGLGSCTRAADPKPCTTHHQPELEEAATQPCRPAAQPLRRRLARSGLLQRAAALVACDGNRGRRIAFRGRSDAMCPSSTTCTRSDGTRLKGAIESVEGVWEPLSGSPVKPPMRKKRRTHESLRVEDLARDQVPQG